MQNFAKWLTRGCEFIAAMILAAIFIIFLLQIFARYTSKIAWLIPIEQLSNWMLTVEPIGWTINLISLLSQVLLTVVQVFLQYHIPIFL